MNILSFDYIKRLARPLKTQVKAIEAKKAYNRYYLFYARVKTNYKRLIVSQALLLAGADKKKLRTVFTLTN